MAKTGMQGINVIAIPFMAIVFGAKPSTGVILPMLCFADLLAVFYYRRTCRWKYVFKPLPAAIAGFFLAIAIDKFIDPADFKKMMSISIFMGLGVMLWMRYNSKREITRKIQASALYAPAFGILGGFSTMIGNAAGSIMSVYLLSMNLPKFALVGTNAWFFLVVNYLKVPLQVFVWHNINLTTLTLNALSIPFIILGAWVGIVFLKNIPEAKYRVFLVGMTVVSALALFFY